MSENARVSVKLRDLKSLAASVSGTSSSIGRRCVCAFKTRACVQKGLETYVYNEPREPLACRSACSKRYRVGAEKAHNFFQQTFWPPPQTPILGPQKKLMCLISWQRTQKRTHINFFGGILGVKNGVPKRAIFGHQMFIVFSRP